MTLHPATPSLTRLFALLATGGSPPSEDQIQQLVDAARSGDPDAARKLYDAYVARVLRTVRPLCRSEAEAEDVTQDTFVTVLSSLHKYKHRPGARFVAWVLTIARNTAHRSARHRRVVPVDSDTLSAILPDREDGADPTADAIDHVREKAALLTALSELPDRDREVVSLRWGGGLKAPEVARVTGLKPDLVRKICQRRRTELLARIEELLRP
jgi:RNA polymerase sigma-70 factor (ECF subfamily)